MISEILKNVLKGVLSGDWARDKDTQHVRAWSDAVGKGFLTAHGLNVQSAAYSIHTSKEAQERALDSGVEKVFTACREPSMPYPIVVGCVMPSEVKGNMAYESYEFTPEYSGVPAILHHTNPIKLGGVLIEPFAACSKPPKAGLPAQFGPTDGPATVSVETPWVVPLTQQAGISSQFIAQNYAKTSRGEAMWEVMGCPELHTWNGIDGKGEEMGFCDGGGTDNMAIFPALRRAVTSIVVGASNSAPPPATAEEWAGFAYDISCYFGRIPEGTKLPQDVPAADMNASLQVSGRHRV
jgi:hypothetical protein